MEILSGAAHLGIVRRKLMIVQLVNIFSIEQVENNLLEENKWYEKFGGSDDIRTCSGND
jgi:hypothetical protein